LDIDDVDAIALCEDEALHLWVPSTSLMSEVDTAVEEFTHCYDRHGGTLLLCLEATLSGSDKALG
jgi:hypothetical protein